MGTVIVIASLSKWEWMLGYVIMSVRVLVGPDTDFAYVGSFPNRGRA